MNEQLAYLCHEAETLKGNYKEFGVGYINLLEATLKFIKEKLLSQLFEEILNHNQNAIEEYRRYLESEVQKYQHRLTMLTNIRNEESYTKRTDRKIEKCKVKLSDAEEKRASFLQDYQSICSSTQPRTTGSFLREIFREPVNGADMISSTRYGSEINDFLLINEAGDVHVNLANIYLFIEVFEQHKTDNLKKLVQLREMKENSDVSPEEIQQLESSIPALYQTANLHVFDRFCHYSSLPWFSSIPSNQVNDDLTYHGREEYVAPIIKHLKLALIVESVDSFNRNDLIALIGEKELTNYESNALEQLTGFSKH